jgi:hypothetical protein
MNITKEEREDIKKRQEEGENILLPEEALSEHELHCRNDDGMLGCHNTDEALWDAHKRMQGPDWEKMEPVERVKSIQDFMKENNSLHLDPNIIAAKMICTSLEGVSRHLKEIKHHLKGESEECPETDG